MLTADRADREVLEGLAAAHPLPRGWVLTECLVDRVVVAGGPIHLVGLVSVGPGQAQATGSAASPAAAPLERAYFELLERTCLLAALASPEDRFPLFDVAGRATGTCLRMDAFPTAPHGASWAYARSNGVAAGPTFAAACRAAALELVERDRILRSWYGDVAPRRLTGHALALELECAGAEHAVHRFEAYEFAADDATTPAVAGIFGFPRIDGAPLVYGFGAGDALDEAVSHAQRECRQRLGFLWGEEIPGAMPAFAPTAAFHQEYYLWPAAHGHLHAWLAGEHVRHRGSLAGSLPAAERLFLDLTPQEKSGQVRVVKALAAGEVPLVFGHGHPRATRSLAAVLAPHPIV